MNEAEARVALSQMYRDGFTGVRQPVFEHLADLFLWPPILVPGDPTATHVRIGEVNVLRHIQGMLAAAADPRLIAREDVDG